MNKETKEEKKKLHIGDKAELTKTFTEDDIRVFAELTLDDNGVHVDPELSARGLFRRPVVHGVLAGSLISSVMGTQLPGHGTVLQGQDIEYLAPVYPGDSVTARVELTEVEEFPKYYIATLTGTCHNQDEVLVAKAVSKELMLKRFFDIQPNNK
ncbi:MAG: MaoC family dehydratase [Firmicutes bacterium]|nr:MaoC family dehydratase [Bacillota bacterium]